MEAASARYAARDRFGAFSEPNQTPLQRYIRKGVVESRRINQELTSRCRKRSGSTKL